MRSDDDRPGTVLEDWDRLDTTGEAPAPTDGPDGRPDAGGPASVLMLMAAAWGDLVTVLGASAAALLAVVAFGYGTGLGALPWALALAVAWWCVAAAALLAIRRGTPGMLLAGVVFADRVDPGRLAATLGVALLTALTAGLPALAGAHRCPLTRVAGSAPVLLIEDGYDGT